MQNRRFSFEYRGKSKSAVHSNKLCSFFVFFLLTLSLYYLEQRAVTAKGIIFYRVPQNIHSKKQKLTTTRTKSETKMLIHYIAA